MTVAQHGLRGLTPRDECGTTARAAGCTPAGPLWPNFGSLRKARGVGDHVYLLQIGNKTTRLLAGVSPHCRRLFYGALGQNAKGAPGSPGLWQCSEAIEPLASHFKA